MQTLKTKLQFYTPCQLIHNTSALQTKYFTVYKTDNMYQLYMRNSAKWINFDSENKLLYYVLNQNYATRNNK